MQPGEISDDGEWLWDGNEWVPAPPKAVVVSSGNLSHDGEWLWDGNNWIPAPPNRSDTWTWTGTRWRQSTATKITINNNYSEPIRNKRRINPKKKRKDLAYLLSIFFMPGLGNLYLEDIGIGLFLLLNWLLGASNLLYGGYIFQHEGGFFIGLIWTIILYGSGIITIPTSYRKYVRR